MTGLLINLTLLCGIVYFMLVRPQLRRRKLRMQEAERMAYLDWRAQQIEEAAAKAPYEGPDINAIAEVRSLWGYPPQQNQVIEQVVSGDQACGWDYAVHIHEATEQYLGPKKFFSLVKDFASIPGVDECKHEDREIFLFRTKILSAEALRAACWEQFMQAAKAAISPKKNRKPQTTPCSEPAK